MDDDYYKVLLFLHICMACVIGWVAKPNTLFSSNQRTIRPKTVFGTIWPNCQWQISFPLL